MATIPSFAVTIAEKQRQKLTALLTVFKALEQPIIGRVEKGKIWLDLRSVADFKALLDTVEKIMIIVTSGTSIMVKQPF